MVDVYLVRGEGLSERVGDRKDVVGRVV